jgi:topoisomerase-4 subunit A
MAVLAEGQSLKVWSGERHMTLSPADLKHHVGERAQRGAVLSRGWRKVDRLEVV